MLEIAMLQATLISGLPGLTIKGNDYAKTAVEILSLVLRTTKELCRNAKSRASALVGYFNDKLTAVRTLVAH